MSAPKKLSDLSDSERLEAYSRLFRFTKEEDIDTADFAQKTGIAVMSVNAMIRHAKQNAKLYEEMVGLGYLDKSFHVWWYSPAREGIKQAQVAQAGITEQEGAQIEQLGTFSKEEEGYDPTPPDNPLPKEAARAQREKIILSSA